MTIFPFTELPLSPPCFFKGNPILSVFSHCSSSIYSFVGSSSVLGLLFFLLYTGFKNNLTNFQVFKYYHYADFRFMSVAHSAPRTKIKRQNTYLNLFKTYLNSQTSQTHSQNKVPVLSPQPFPLLTSSIPAFCISVNGTIVYLITKVKHMSIIHGSSWSFILVSNPAANPVNYASEIPSDCYFYSLFLLPSHFVLPSSLSSITRTAPNCSLNINSSFSPIHLHVTAKSDAMEIRSQHFPV